MNRVVAKPFKGKWYLHMLHGFTAGAVFFMNAVLSIFLYVQFGLYEYVEETKLKDEMYAELLEWSIGFLIGLTLGIKLLRS